MEEKRLFFGFKTDRSDRKAHTYTISVLVKSEGAMPGVQVNSYDGALTKASGELHFIPFVLEVTFKHTKQYE